MKTTRLAVLLLFSVLAQAAGLKPESLLKWRYVSDAQISPDGKRIAYVHYSTDEAKDTYNAAIWLADVSSGATRQLTQGDADRKSTRLNSSHIQKSRMPSSA